MALDMASAGEDVVLSRERAEKRRRASPPPTAERPATKAALITIAVGFLMLFQPFALALYTYSFVTMLAGTVMFIIVSKFPE